jgi:ABC-type Na+ efflux pump permease subunit
MGKNVLPLALVMLVLLVVVTGFSASRGLHLQDGIYTLGVDDAAVGEIFSSDARFTVYQADAATLWNSREYLDTIIIGGEVYGSDTDKGRAAVRALQSDYEGYLNRVYAREADLFAAYPLWIDVQNVKSELDFTATLAGQQVAAPVRQSRPPVPSGPVIAIPTPAATLGIPESEIRQGLVETQGSNSQITRYSELLTGESPFGDYTIPSQLTPPLPFDTIILVFVFIFPLYFTSQFFMMSIMNERLERKGEVLLTTPLRPAAIILGKALPYFLLMIAISTLLILWLGAELSILFPLLPVILFFLASALIIGMISRSFKELSFLSIFFSTVATAYLFFPSIFANVHIISLISPLTLVVLTLQGEPYTIVQYFYSTSLFYLTSAVLFYLALVNFREDRLFSQARLGEKFQDFISTAISEKRPYISLFLLNALLIPFVFMAQMMVLVLFFNLPMPLSLVLLLVFAAFIEEFAKSIGILSLNHRDRSFLTWKRLAFASVATAAGFLLGEKLLTFLTLTQITESVFGSILFLSLGALWLPFLLHFTGVFIVGTGLKLKGRAGYIVGLMVATLVHCLYNLYFILGVISL